MNTEEIVNQSIPKSDFSTNLKIKEKVSYGLGDLACNLAWAMTGSFLLYFYTNVCLVPVAATGTILLLARIFDAITDPLMGLVVDRTKSKYGKARPYLLYGAIPFGVLSILTFTAPNLSDMGKVIYAAATYLLLGLAYTAINIPYGALMSMMTRNSSEKMKLSSFRTLGMGIGGVLVNAATMPLVIKLGGGNEKQGFLITMTIYAIISVILYMVVFKNCKERYTEGSIESKEKISFIESIKLAFKNLHWVSTFLFAFFLFIRIGVVIAITIYYCIYVLKNPTMISILLPLVSGSAILSSVIATPFLKRFGTKNGNVIALLASIIAYSMLPLLEGNMTLFVIVYLFSWTIGGVAIPSVFVMIANSVDFHQWKFKQRTEGVLYSGYSFATKVGMAIGGAIVAYSLALMGFNPESVSEAIANKIHILYFVAPIVLSILQMMCLIPYDLDKLHPQIVEDLAKREAIQ